MENINWLRSVGKVIVFKLEGTKDDDATAVYDQTIATTIRVVNVSEHYTDVFFETAQVFGDELIDWEFNSISIRNKDKLILIDVDGYNLDGEVIEVY